jgi:hypothetical protein
MTQPLDLDQIEARAAEHRAALSGWLNCYSPLPEQEALEGAEGVLKEAMPAMAAEIRRLRDELATARDRYTAGLRKADEHVNAMSEELKRYADGKETPVVWSVYNAMHSRAATAEGRVASVAALCNAAEKQATRWEHPLPVPEWVDAVRQAIQQPAAEGAHVVADDTIWLERRPCGCVVAAVVAIVPGAWTLTTAEDVALHFHDTEGERRRAAAAGLTVEPVTSAQYREQFRDRWHCGRHATRP